MSDGGVDDVVRRQGVADSPSDTRKTISPPRKHRPSNGHLSEPLRPTKPHDTPEGHPPQRDLALALALATSLLPSGLNVNVNLIGILALIFGGCCSNVFALEAIISSTPSSGTLITFTQVLLTTLFTLPSHVSPSRGLRHLYLKRRHIPLHQWALSAALFITINMLNNQAFNYHISIPLHIILRSAGPVATMTIGYLAGKRYPTRHALAVLLLFLGVVQAALCDARAHAGATTAATPTPSPRSRADLYTGFSILFVALLLSAGMGLFSDRLYARHGRTAAAEHLFYSHALSLPVFLFRLPALRAQLGALARSPPASRVVRVPAQLLVLLCNGLTQYVCIRGVSQLSATTSALTVGIVLNVRKLLSLLLSVWLFGNHMDGGVVVGAAVVFVGGALYAWPAGRGEGERVEEEGKKGKKDL